MRLLFGEDYPVVTRDADAPDVFGEYAVSHEELRNALYIRPLRIKRLAVIITTHCSLCCPHCLHLNPHYQKREDFDGEKVLSLVQRILSVADCIEQVVVMGGEAMLHPQLPSIMAALNNEPRLLEVCLTTNGHQVPPLTLIDALKFPRSRVFISNYGSTTAPETTECIRLFEDNAICYKVAPSGSLWIDAGGPEDRGRSREDRVWMFAHCLFASCLALMGDALYVCPRNANAVKLGIIPHEISGGLRLSNKTGKDLKEHIIDTIYLCDEIVACGHCSFIVKGNEQKKIPRGS
jgi:hypothetical protein